MIYLDNASTTDIDPAVQQAMAEWKQYANAGSIHMGGVEARRQICDARRSVADFLGCDDNQVVFTSGGSESNATVVRGFRDMFGNSRNCIAFSAVEHESVRANVELMTKIHRDWTTHEIPVSHYGTVNMDELCAAAADKNVSLVSVMAVNNEVPAINNIKEIARICHESGVALHTDCVQAVGAIDLDVDDLGCDFMSLSAHKFHGPKGVGVLYCRDKKRLLPLIAGSETQEFGMRGGTENVAGIIGLGVAAKIAKNEESAVREHISLIKSRFYSNLVEALSSRGMGAIIHNNGLSVDSPGKILSLIFDGVDAQSLVLALSARNAYISAGSACNARSSEGSKVLRAIGLSEEQAHSTVRISFSKFNTESEAVEAARLVVDTVVLLRAYAE